MIIKPVYRSSRLAASIETFFFLRIRYTIKISTIMMIKTPKPAPTPAPNAAEDADEPDCVLAGEVAAVVVVMIVDVDVDVDVVEVLIVDVADGIDLVKVAVVPVDATKLVRHNRMHAHRTGNALIR